jgi:hypothetical protein
MASATPLQQLSHIKKTQLFQNHAMKRYEQNLKEKSRLIRKFLPDAMRRSKGGGLKLMHTTLMACGSFFQI